MKRTAAAFLKLMPVLLAASGSAAAAVVQAGYDGATFVITNRPATGRALSPLALAGTAFPLAPSRRAPMPHLAELGDKILLAAQRHGLDVDLVRAVIHVESRFNPGAHSPAGAVGLMQVMPATAARFGITNLLDADSNLEAGCRYLAHLIQLFDGNVSLALAAYNAGEGAVIKHGHRIPPYGETQRYVPTVLNRWRELARSGTRG